MTLLVRTSLLGWVIAVAGCANVAHSPSSANASSFATQRACVHGLQGWLQTDRAKSIASFFSSTLDGVVRCEAESGLAHVPTRDVSRWLNDATGRVREAVPMPPQPAFLAVRPQNDGDRIAYQSNCTAWLEAYLPALIEKNGDEAETAAADVFNGIEECDAAAGFARISREELARLMKSKHLL